MNVLLDLVESFYLTRKERTDKIKYVVLPQDVKNKNVSGELLEYYQHIHLEENCSFRNKFFNMELIAINSDSRDPEYLGLDYFEKWNDHYEIFAQTMGEDIIFCDTRSSHSPVYGLYSGGDDILKLSNSLFKFLSFYSEITKVQFVDFNEDIFSDDNYNLKEDFIEEIQSIMAKTFSESERAGLMTFMFG